MPNVPEKADWYHDPSGRHQYRYWNGSGWTEKVADDGVQASDPSLSPRWTLKGVSEQRASDVPTKERIDIVAPYLGGHPIHEKHSGGGLMLNAAGVHFRGFRELFVIPWSDVIDIAVEGTGKPHSSTKVVPIPFAVVVSKKRVSQTSRVIVTTAQGDAIFECTKMGPDAVAAKLTPAAQWFSAGSAP